MRRSRQEYEAILAEHRWALGVFARHVIGRSAPALWRAFEVLTAEDSPTAVRIFRP